MKVYLSGAIRGGRQLQNIYQEILDFLQENGHNVLTYHVAKKNVLEIETKLKDTEIFTQDVSWLEECDCVIAEVTVASLGVGYEIAFALAIKKCESVDEIHYLSFLAQNVGEKCTFINT